MALLDRCRTALDQTGQLSAARNNLLGSQRDAGTLPGIAWRGRFLMEIGREAAAGALVNQPASMNPSGAAKPVMALTSFGKGCYSAQYDW
mmetsp:Transcript_66358/g.147465  ORF Transcript_66358/g.147465 Transcript_66358/m.147465 type:complete len:90 (+) Transcript_66358:400-669(+)